MVENVITGLLVTGLGGFVAWAALNSTREDVNPRSAPGLRTPTTMSSREAWLAAHRVISGPLWWSGVALTTIGSGIVAWSLAGSPSQAEVERVALGAGIGFVIAALAMVVVGERAARRASKDGSQ